MTARDHASATSGGTSLTRERNSWVLCLFVVLFAAAAGLCALLAAPALTQAAAQEYAFTKVADSSEDNFDPFNFGCAAMNNRGDIAFRAGRVAANGNTTDGIYRANASGGITTIAQDRRRFDFLGRNPSIIDGGEVSFAASLANGEESILRGSGGRLTTIATTTDRYNFFGFDTSVNNAGRGAFHAELDEEFDFDEGLFSGTGGQVTTHYLASTSQFDGSDSRPSINNPGDIAFEERRDGDQGIFVTDGNGFTTIGEAEPDGFVGEPVLNDEGLVVFETSYTDPDSGEFVTEVVSGTGGPLTTLVDTRGEFASFGFRPPSLNNGGDIAFFATLDDFSTSGIFVGPDPVEDRVIATGDTLDGRTVQNLVFCEEGLNDSGQLAFVADLEDPDSPDGFRTAVFRATPQGDPECTITGTAGPDELTGTAGDDVICGRAGKDTIRGLGGNDTLLGNKGNEREADAIFGGGGDDTLLGGNGSDNLVGGPGNDRHSGGNQNDRLDSRDGVEGNDTLSGNSGTDTCLADTSDNVSPTCER